MSKRESTICERVPIVTILGHVDHGKTTLLDSIRKSNVQSGEVGGITQRVSVFTVNVKDDKNITFIDTPGHEAFDLMRSRGGSIADIVLLIVSADDGVMPQTKESIEIIQNSKAKPIVVITKCDLPNIDLAKIKRDIVNNGILLEGMGGTVPFIEVSAKSGKGIQELLDLIILLSEVEGLQEREKLPKGVNGRAFVLESVKDCFKGNISSLVFIQGGVCPGDFIGYKSGDSYNVEKVKGLITEECQSMVSLNCGCGGKILGISDLLELGTEVYVLEKGDSKILRDLYQTKEHEEEAKELSMEDFFVNSSDDLGKHLNVIIKASSEGSLEAIRNAIDKIKEEDCTVKIIQDGVGNITLRDVENAMISKAIVLGFEVNLENGVEDFARRNKVLLRTYDIIYKLLEEVKDAVSLMTLPESAEEEIGNATVKVIFVLSNGSKVYGSRVDEGIMKRDCKIDVVRNDEIIGEGKIKSLRINKDVVTEVKSGFDCGIQLEKELDILEGDKIYCYKVIR